MWSARNANWMVERCEQVRRVALELVGLRARAGRERAAAARDAATIDQLREYAAELEKALALERAKTVGLRDEAERAGRAAADNGAALAAASKVAREQERRAVLAERLVATLEGRVTALMKARRALIEAVVPVAVAAAASVFGFMRVSRKDRQQLERVAEFALAGADLPDDVKPEQP